MLPPLRLCAFCDIPIPVETDPDEVYCNRKCFDAHVDEALKKDAQPFPPPEKHGKYCCCIYC